MPAVRSTLGCAERFELRKMGRYTLGGLCEAIERHGLRPELRGDGSREITSVATLEEAGDGQISFLSNAKYEKMLWSTGASAVVLRPEVQAPERLDLIRVSDPYAAITILMVTIHGYRKHPPPPANGHGPMIAESAEIGEGAKIHAGATIDEGVRIGRNAVIYPGCYVGPRCRIGDDLLLYPNVVIYDDSIIGDRVTVHASTVVANDGLGYAPVGDKWIKIPQIGIVQIGDDVEIGSNCSIDRATIGRTVIGAGTKMSNLVAIGHGARIGENCMLVAQVGLAGSVDVGNHVTMAGQAGVVGHIRVGDNAVIGAKAGVTNNVADGETVLGQPAIPIAEMKRRVALLGRLPELRETMKSLKQKMSRLEKLESEVESLRARLESTRVAGP